MNAPAGTREPTRLEEWNGAELVISDEPELTSLAVLGQPNVVIESQAHIVAAAPKAGKTTLITQTVRVWD